MGERKRRQQAALEGKGQSLGSDRTQKGRRFGKFRITWRTVGLFMLTMLILDLIAFAVMRYGFDSCYGILCLF